MRARPDRVRARAVAQRADRRGGRDARERLDQLRDLRAGEPVVAVAALGDDGEEPGVDEPPEVLAGGRRRDARLRGEHARRQRATVAEREQHPRPRALAEDRAEGGEVGVSGHEVSVGPQRFGGGRNGAGVARERRCAAPTRTGSRRGTTRPTPLAAPEPPPMLAAE